MPTVPGLYGNPNQIQVDVSRVPRVDQCVTLSTQADNGVVNADLVSDVRNVSYYVINGGTAAPGLISGNASSGLVRREISRPTGVYASQQTGQRPVNPDSLTPIAPEVQEIDFLYTDGTQWLDTWDSVSYAGLPVAVQVSIVITPSHPRANVQPDVYRLLVSIPAANAATLTTTSSASSTSSTSSTSTTTSTAN